MTNILKEKDNNMGKKTACRLLASLVAVVYYIGILGYTEVEAEEIEESYCFFAENEQEAEEIAKAKGGILENYAYGIGTMIKGNVDNIAIQESVTQDSGEVMRESTTQDSEEVTQESTTQDSEEVTQEIATQDSEEVTEESREQDSEEVIETEENLTGYENIPLYKEQIYFVEENESTTEGIEQWYLNAIHAPKSWSIAKGKDILVSVVDTGIDTDHEDLADGIVQAVSVIPHEYYDGSKSIVFNSKYEGQEDCMGHGTHVAGIIGARQNKIGVVGVAPDCRILSVKALELYKGKGAGKSGWIAAAIRYSIEQGSRIINLSIGGNAVNDPLLEKVIDEAAGAGCIVVCAAGNITGESQVFYPAAYEHTITVGATGKDGKWLSFSNYGDYLDIVAPGENIYSTVIGGYGTKSGTSMACGVVTGEIALLLEKNKSLNEQDILKLMKQRAVNENGGAKDPKMGYGFLDAYKLLKNENTDSAQNPASDSGSEVDTGENVENSQKITETTIDRVENTTEDIEPDASESEQDTAADNWLYTMEKEQKTVITGEIVQIEGSETESIEETFEESSETEIRRESEITTEEISNNSESTENTDEPHKYGVIIILCALAVGVLVGRNIIGKITMK